MLVGINHTQRIIDSRKNQAFTAKGDFSYKVANGFLQYIGNTAKNRFIQDTATNWFPAAVLTRSFADLGDKTFLEFIESAIFYFLPTAFGNSYKKAYTKFHPKNITEKLNEKLGSHVSELLNKNGKAIDDVNKRALSTKAAIVLGCTVIPAAEYALSFAKNLFTLKCFKKSDFNNIANLNKDQKEDIEQQKRVEKSAKSHLKKFGAISLTGLAGSLILAKYGHNSSLLQRFSNILLQPGALIAKLLQKKNIIKKDSKTEKFLRRYITPDFAGINEQGRFKLSEGQLLITTLSGLFGYSAAAKDRGKLDKYEVWTRVPFVVLYTVFGSALFDKAFNHIFVKKKIFPNIIKKAQDGSVQITESKDLKKIAKVLAESNNTTFKEEFIKLTKQKAVVKSIPYLFGIGFMGFFLSGITRFWTQYRYNIQQKKNRAHVENLPFEKLKKQSLPNAFSGIKAG